MTLQVDQALENAYELIKSDQLDAAEALIKPLIEGEADNPDVWWIYAHALRDKDGARLALQNVLRLDPEYPGAAELLQDMDAYSARQVASAQAVAPISSIQPSELPADLPDDSDNLDDDDEFVPIYRRPIFVLGLGICIILLILLLSSFRKPADSTPLVTAVPQLDSAIANAFSTAFAAMLLSKNGVALEQSALGNTLTVSVCTNPGSEMRQALRDSWDTLKKQSASIPSDVSAVGVHLVQCVADSDVIVPLRSIITPTKNVLDYASGAIDERGFQMGWQVDENGSN